MLGSLVPFQEARKCAGLISVARISITDQKRLGKGNFGLYFQNSPSLRKSGKELKREPEVETAEERCLVAQAQAHAQKAFLYRPEPFSQETVLL